MFSSANAGIAILGMAVVTYFTRIAGFYLVNRINVKGRMETFLEAIPGTILMAIVAPIVFASGAPEAIAAAVVVLIVWRTKSLPLAMFSGVLAVFLARNILY